MREKWFSMSVADIEKKLKTNAALGLNHKAARSRFSEKNGFLFETEERGILSLLPSVLSDFSVIILLVMAVVAICFGEGAMGGMALAMSLICLLVSLVFYYRDEIYFASAKRAMAPRCRVIRQGKLYSVSPRHVVVGDIILLGEGDVVPADARLITSDSLKVKMPVERNKYLLLEKLAEGAVSQQENDPTRFINIVHAGSVVLAGAARAVVTAVGRYTYAGAKFGTVLTAEDVDERGSELLARLKKSLSKISMALLVASLPISILSMLLGGDKLSLFSVFMTSISAAFLCSVQLSATLFNIFYEIPARRLVMTKDTAVIKDVRALEAIGGAKYVFLLDGGALTDGIWHLDSVCVGEGEFKSYEALPVSGAKLADLASLYLDAKKAGLSLGNERYSRLDDGIADFVSKANVDKDALKIRCSTSGYIEAGVASPCDKVMFTELDGKYVLSVSYSENIISECTGVRCDEGIRDVSDAFVYSAKETFRNYVENGKRALVFCIAKNEGYGVEGEKCFVGMIAFSERTEGFAEKAKKELIARGTKVIAFKNIVTDGADRVSKIPDSLLGKERADIRDFVAASKPLSHRLGEIDCYENFSVAQVEELIGHIHKKGERVAVIGISDKFERIYRAADATVTVSLDKYSCEPFENAIRVKINPKETRTEAGAQSIRQKADAVIPRYADGKGGLLSFLSIFKGAAMAANNLTGFVRYLVLATTVRIATVLLPTLLGALTVDARHLLLVGVVSDLLALFAFAYDGRMPTGAYNVAARTVRSPIAENKKAVVIFGAGAVCSTLLPALISLIPGMPAYIDRVEYSLVSLVAFHVAVFLSLRLPIREKRWIATAAVPAVLLAVLGLCFVGGIADLLDVEGFSGVAYFFLAFLCPLISGSVYLLLGRKERNNKGNL